MLKRNQSSSRITVKTGKNTVRLNRRVARRVAGAVLAVGLLSAASYLLLIASEFVTGVTRVEAAPRVVRLQVVTPNVNTPTRHRLIAAVNESIQNGSYSIEIVEQETLPNRSVTQTLIVSRQPDLEPAQYLAAELGLPGDRVSYQPLEFNRNLVAVTLFIGDDLSFEPNNKPSARND